MKYEANSFLNLKVSYINELAKLCNQLNINITNVAKGMGLDNRNGTSAAMLIPLANLYSNRGVLRRSRCHTEHLHIGYTVHFCYSFSLVGPN
ncbi:hypothetical protein [Bacillus sp. AFS018417]|uniref:hypothetical protein n=1 Tax=Bacillus sp. AFS018417 TaxID=2033491 RepID=UPI0020D213FC|nr:hypothetical protein [Bacillus sp. AFS018417]